MFAFVAIGEVALKVFHLKSPYMIWQNMIISGILFEGWLFRNYSEKYMPKNKFALLVIGMTIAMIIGLLVSHGWLFNLQAAHLNEAPAVLVLIVAFIGSMMVYAFSTLLSGSAIGKVLVVVGNHSFSIMLLHFLAFKFVNFVMCVLNGSAFMEISCFPTMPYSNIGWCVAYVAVGCALPIGVVMAKGYMSDIICRKICQRK